MNFADLTSALGVVLGCSFSVIVWFAHRPERPTRFLAVFIFTIAARAIPALLYRLPAVEPKFVVSFLPFHFFYLSIPVLYLYALRLTHRFRWSRDWIHLLPGALELVFCCTMIGLWFLGQESPFEPALARGVIGTYTILAIGPGLLYSLWIILTLRRHRHRLRHYYSNLEGKGLNWIAYALYLNIFVSTVYTILRYGPLRLGVSWSVVFGALTNTILVAYVSYQGIRQLDLRPQEDIAGSAGDGPDSEDPESEAQHALFRQLGRYLEESRAYLDPSLTLSELAARLNRGERTLSRVINTQAGSHFNGYINDYRIAAAQELLRDPAYDHFTLEGIAGEAGFNSKSTFYKAFRERCELSPSVYRSRRDSFAGR